MELASELQGNSCVDASVPQRFVAGDKLSLRWRRARSVTTGEVASYYDAKTAAIIKRYGPGPRVHYHTGLVDELVPAQRSAAELRRELTSSQERILCYAAEVWKAGAFLSGEVLDVGCGLGGGSIFWAQEYGARVTAVTCVAAHAPLISDFAAQAGVATRVNPLICDAHQVPGEKRFDAAVAIDSSCHLERPAWFRRVARLLRSGGRLFILDCFLGRPECAQTFNQHWCARIGDVTEYLEAAAGAGLKLTMLQDLSSRTQHFWSTSSNLIANEAQEEGVHSRALSKIAERDESLMAHTFMRRHLGDQGLIYALLCFAKN